MDTELARQEVGGSGALTADSSQSRPRKI